MSIRLLGIQVREPEPSHQEMHYLSWRGNITVSSRNWCLQEHSLYLIISYVFIWSLSNCWIKTDELQKSICVAKKKKNKDSIYIFCLWWCINSSHAFLWRGLCGRIEIAKTEKRDYATSIDKMRMQRLAKRCVALEFFFLVQRCFGVGLPLSRLYGLSNSKSHFNKKNKLKKNE